jgi:hypothetical protein
MMRPVIHERRGWQRFSILLVVTILTVATFATVVHRHIGADDQGCVLCHARHDPGMDRPQASFLGAPESSERPMFVAEFRMVSSDIVRLHPGRAPPSSF